MDPAGESGEIGMIPKIRLWSKNWLPPIVQEKRNRFRAWLKFRASDKKELLNKNVALKNTAKGRRAFLIATGPSLKMEDLSTLAGEDCYGISNLFLHEHIQSINPKFHFFAPYHEPLTLESYIEWLESADKSLPPETGIFLTDTMYDLVKKYKLFPARKIFYLHWSEYPAQDNVDITKPVLSPQTGPLMALPVLLYMGYSEIYLLGCDHTEMRDYKKTVKNFYDPSRDVRKTNPYTIEVWYSGVIHNLSSTLNTFKQYLLYKEILRGRDVKIVNLSQDSWLDLFEMDTLKNVIAGK